ncbi:MAG: alpha-galactosidase [Fimbriimonas sp.]|nr:alpha-galactosidase [Fimbriimonas sp.]
MRASLLIAILLMVSTALSAATSGRNEADSRRWTNVKFEPVGANMPFSFRYGGQTFAALADHWKGHSEFKHIDSRRTSHTVTWSDPDSGLRVKCVAVEYSDFPAVEWTVYLKNEGTDDTKIVEDLQALDRDFERSGTHEFLLRHNVGSPASKSDYAPLETPLGSQASLRLSAAGGRPTNTNMSYFNVDEGDRGTIFVVGWPGQWAADFTRNVGSNLHIRCGQERTHFKLHPGEEVRTPLIVLLDWKGDWIDGQNQWRRWMMAYGMPKPGGQLPKPIMEASSSRAYEEMIGANEESQIMHIDRYLAERLKLDYWWMDAGWYVQQRGWPQVGTWEVDPKRFPHGFKAISDHAHAKGVKILVWFEPERVAPDTWLSTHHPEWLLNPVSSLEIRNSSVVGRNEPNLVFNTASDTLAWNGITWKARGLSLHPGAKGEYGVVRWTAPTAGPYSVQSSFSGIDEKTTTDVHVIKGHESLFDSFINLNGRGRHDSFHGAIDMMAGETLDFVVGFGNGDYANDSTGIDATVVGPDGVRHDAAEEYGKGAWSYGLMAAGPKPEASTFQPFDRKLRGGASSDQLLNLGNPEARHWLTEHVDKLIVDNGIDLYRQDFNIDPLSFWRANDPPDRQGITENKHVVGYLAYWDELRRRHPNMLIDSCASGGRRNDLETMRRAVPLWRSDYAYEPIGHQGMTYGISMWLPFHGTGTVATTDAPYYGGGFTKVDPYAFWSNTAPSLGSGIDVRVKEIDYAALRRLFGAWRTIGKFYYGDYYPLTPYSQEDSVWIGWQFHVEKTGQGVVQVFRRANAPSNVTLKLRGLDASSHYRFKVLEGEGRKGLEGKTWSGAELMQNGLTVELATHPAAAVLTYSLVK